MRPSLPTDMYHGFVACSSLIYWMNWPPSVYRGSLRSTRATKLRRSPDSVKASEYVWASSAISLRKFPSKSNIWTLLLYTSATVSVLLLSFRAISQGSLNCPCCSPPDPNWNANWYWCGITCTTQGLPVSGCPLTWISTLCCPTHCDVYVTVYFLLSLFPVDHLLELKC